MLNLKRKCITSALCGVIMLTVSIPVVCASSFDHKMLLLTSTVIKQLRQIDTKMLTKVS